MMDYMDSEDRASARERDTDRVCAYATFVANGFPVVAKGPGSTAYKEIIDGCIRNYYLSCDAIYGAVRRMAADE
jgi:hypothetical protein